MWFQIAVLALLPNSASGHRMGEAVPIAFVEGSETGFAASVIAVYFSEQMGKEIGLVPGKSSQKCLDMVRTGIAPMAVLDRMPAHTIRDVVVVEPVLAKGGEAAVLVMGERAVRQLQFSLVPRYMEKLGNVLDAADWELGLARVRAGEGIRKAAIDMLRDKDLI